jgi:hypothetical protein
MKGEFSDLIVKPHRQNPWHLTQHSIEAASRPNAGAFCCRGKTIRLRLRQVVFYWGLR